MTFFKSNFIKILEKCTSNLLLEPDWDGMLQLCDLIRGNDIKPRDAVAAIKKTLEIQNPHQQYFGYCVLDTVVKNCGAPIHQEVIKRSFLEQLKDRIQGQQTDQVGQKILEMIQTWGIAGRSKHEFKLAADLYNIMKVEGYQFPEAVADNELIVDAAVAPVWKEGDECFRCKTAFGVITRKHHCRACGNIFCDKCSSKTSTVPKFGIEKEVRVCDSCYTQLQSGRAQAQGPQGQPGQSEGKKVTWADDQSWQDDQAAVMERYQRERVKKADKARKSQEEEARLKEQEELELAIALSLDEAEQSKRNRSPQQASSGVAQVEKEPEPPAADQLPALASDGDSDLQKYLDRSYWEQRNTESESAEAKKDEMSSLPTYQQTQVGVESANGSVSQDIGLGQATSFVLQNDTTAEEAAEKDQNSKFCKNLSASLDIFMNRMKADQARGKPISMDVTVQTLFKQITELHPALLDKMQKLEDKRTYWEGLSDKVNAINDARTALDALRHEHKEEMKRRKEEAERQRQILLAQKLELMRQKKREYLESQRAATLARMAESQAALHAKREANRTIQVQKQIPQGYQYQQPVPAYQQYPPTANHIPHEQYQQYNPPHTGDYNAPQPAAYQPMYSNEQVPVTNPGQLPPMPQHQQISYAPPGAQPMHQPHPGQADQSGYVPNLPTVPTHEPQPAHQPVANQEPPAQEPVAEAQLISFD